MKRILSFLLMVGFCLSIPACSQKQMSENNDKDDKKNQMDTSSSEKNNNSQENADTIKLSINNFTDFFTCTKALKINPETKQYWNAYTIEGVLDFAYYKDVVVTFKVTYQVSATSKGVETIYVVHPNAAGDVSFFEKHAAKSLGISKYDKINFEVKSVSGELYLYK